MGIALPLLAGMFADLAGDVHFKVTQNPTAQWTAQQIVEAFAFDTAPRNLLRERDSIYGEHFRRRVISALHHEYRPA